MNAAVAFSLENLQTAPGPGKGLAQNLKVFGSRNITPPNHRPKNYSGDGAVSHPAKDRTWRQPKLVPLNKSEVARYVAEALRQDFGQRAAKHKVIAEAAGAASENTAKAWTRQVSLPALEYFLELGRRSPALRAMTLRIWEMESEMDPELQKAFTEFCQMMAKR